MDWQSAQFLILGLGRSGRGAIDLILRFGGKPAGYDRTPPGAADAKQFAEWEEEGARFSYGEPDEALLNDIDIVVVSPGITALHVLVAAAGKRGIPVIAEIELAYRAADCPIIAVTGTNGKSTTTSLIGEILKREGRRVAVAGNIGRPLTDVVGPYRDYDFIVAEISSFQLETIDRFRPKVAVLLNLTDDHLDRHGTFENYGSIKARLFENQNETDAAILNYDDPAVRRIGNKLKGRVLWFSRGVGGNLPGVSLTYGEIRSRIDEDEELVGLERDIAMPGPHNRMNALAAVAAAKVMDVPGKVIRETLQTFPGLEHRLERVRMIRAVTFINDSKATNVDSVYYALQSFDSPIIWIAGGRPKKPEFERLVDLVNIHVRAMVLIGEARKMLDLTFEHFSDRYYADTMEKAVTLAYRMARPGEIVLLSPGCASFDMFDNFERRGDAFKAAVHALEEREKQDV